MGLPRTDTDEARATGIATEIVGCGQCGSDDHEVVGTARDFEYATSEDEYTFVRCRSCGLVYLRNRPALSELGRIYPPHYASYGMDEYLGGAIARIRRQVQKLRIRPIKKYAPPGSLIVDVGCGSGDLLALLKQSGDPSWKLVGVDFSEDAMKNLAKLGIEGRRGSFETMDWAGPAPDLVIMNQVIEHLANPPAAVAKVFACLRPGGYLMMETPSVDGWDAKVFARRYWAGWHTPRHFNVYDERTLSRLVRDAGFEVESTSHMLSPNFWLQSIHHALGERGTSPRLRNLFDVRFFPALAVASAVDVVQLAVHRRTSNLRLVARKPLAAT